ncbi:ribonuclease Y [Nitratifractor sp.]
MWIQLALIAPLIFVFATAAGYWLARRSMARRFDDLELEAKARAKAIEAEARALLRRAEEERRQKERELNEEYRKLLEEAERRNRALIAKERELEEERSRLLQKENTLDERIRIAESFEAKKRAIFEEFRERIEHLASMTQDEARELLLENVRKKLKGETAAIIRKEVAIAKEEARRKANYILAQATTRYAGEFAGERLINTVTLPSDEHKGRIIGKEGRNIKTLEQLLGVDIIIDETPGVIVVSGFNLYRRAIATRVIELLVEDGRIHPGRIEEVHRKVQEEFEQHIYEEGENVVLDLGLFPMHEELIKLIGRLKYRASYGQNALAHSLEVARLARVMAAEMGGDEKLALRAGLLHDIGKALTQDFGGSHVELGAELCRKYNEHPTVINAIYAHHGQEEPINVESAAVCAADALSAARPGARREVLESFTRRVRQIEVIAQDKEGVSQAYAINAGRELRVFVDAGKIDDDRAAALSHEIARDIEEKVQYPGEVKVTVIRELRRIDYAR